MSKVTYQSPRNTVFYALERGGLFTVDAVARFCHLAHSTAERALNANVTLGRVVRDGEFYTVAEAHRVPWTLRTWDILAERLLARLPVGERKDRYQTIYEYALWDGTPA